MAISGWGIQGNIDVVFSNFFLLWVYIYIIKFNEKEKYVWFCNEECDAKCNRTDWEECKDGSEFNREKLMHSKVNLIMYFILLAGLFSKMVPSLQR